MATLNCTNNILNQLHDVKALMECVESQLEADCGGDHPALRVLHIAYDRLAESINLLDELSVTLPDSATTDPEVLAIKRFVESDGKSH